ncbi:MAG: hypothetical protein JW889_06075 [Verrucomicrobia bacterium]|nr:hypothetical protein [Verrucomicrobiota bacterium]
MNVRAHDLTVLLRAILGTLPGATSIGIHASEHWAFVLITVSSDEAVVALGEALGLACDVRIGKRRWWRRATSEAEQGRLQIVVAGPPHAGQPPRDGTGTASS